MKKVHYRKIIIEGFQSIVKPMVFNLDNVGLNLIKGINGAGKSTLFNAILWAEYGVNLKKNVTTWQEFQPENYKGTRVVVERTDGEFVYRVARHLKFKGKTTGLSGGDKLMIFKRPISEPKFTDAHLVGDGLHKSDMQLLINEQIGMDSKTFLSSIFFGQSLDGLIKTDNKSKRDLFEKLFDVGFIEQAKSTAKLEQAKLDGDITNLKTEVENAEDNLSTSEERLEEQQGILSSFAETQKQRMEKAGKAEKEAFDNLKNLKEDLSTYKKDAEKYSFEALDDLKVQKAKLLENIETATKSYDSAKKDVDSCTKEQETAEKNIEKYEKELENIEETCPSCEQPIKKSTIATIRRNIKAKIKDEKEVIKVLKTKSKGWDKVFKIAEKNKNTLDKDLEKLQSKIDKFSDDKIAFAKLETNIENTEEKIIKAEKTYSDAQKSYREEKDAKKPKIDTKATEQLIEDYKRIIENSGKDLDSAYEKLDKVKWWISKGFGSSGLKAFVFNAMLSKVNSFAQQYAAKLGFRVEFSVDMSKESKPFQTLIYKGDTIKDYEDLSGGQQQRVNICIAFAMHDLIASNSDINVLVMDEVFDGLDNEGTEVVFELLREKTATKSVYLITHLDLIDSLNSRSFTFNLDENGNTYLKQ